MADDAKLVEVEIVTPDGNLWKQRAELVVVTGVEGQLGIMARHQPLISLLAIGDTHLRMPDGAIERFATGIGYVEVLDDNVRVVVDHAEQAGQIDVPRAEAARRRAEERLALRDDPGAKGEVDFYRAEQSLKRAINRLKVVERAGAPR